MKLSVVLLLSLAISASADMELGLGIKVVKILHDITTPKDMTGQPWPVLFVELDVGKVCMLSQAPSLANFDRENFPECTQLLCVGPGGPISVWTQNAFMDTLGSCVLTGIFSIDPPNFENLPDRFMEIDVIRPPPRPTKVNFFSSLRSNLKTVLTDQKIMSLRFTEKARFLKALRVVVDSFVQGPLSFCLAWHEDIISIATGSHAAKYFKNCDMICPIFKEHFFIFEDSKIADEIWGCLGSQISTRMGNFPAPLGFEKDGRSGKIKILLDKKPMRYEEIREFEPSPAQNSGSLKFNATDYKDEL